jgi:hypothetical protein
MSLGKHTQADLQWALLQFAYAVFGAAIMESERFEAVLDMKYLGSIMAKKR